MNSQVEEIVQLLKYGKKPTHKYTQLKKQDESKIKRVTPVADSLERAKEKVKKSIKRKRVDYLSE